MKQIVVILTMLFSLLGMQVFGQNVASVTVGSADPVLYTDFDEAWTYAMSQQEATITLLSDITRTATISYRPKVADGRHTLDLNNHKITENTSDRLLVVNKSDAKLTITDSSPAQGGCLYKQQESTSNIYTVIVYQGEVEVAGGKVYCENTIDDPDDENWHPSIALNANGNTGAVIRVSGGMIESVSKHTAYAISSYDDVYITAGHMRAIVTKYKNARALSQQLGTAYIDGGTFEAYAKGPAMSAFTVCATSWIDTISGTAQNGEVYINGGTFIAETENNNACAVRSDANVARVNSGDIVKAHGTMHINGGTFIVRASNPSASQVFGAVSNGARFFDNAKPHHLIEESLGIINISGGDFTVDTRDSEGHYVDNSDNIDLLRNWGTLNVSGGTFTLYQHNGGTGIGCYRNKVTVSGNPIFTIHGARNTRGVVAGPWNHANYCDADASKNKAEIEVYGGTFTLVTDSANADGIYANSIAAWAYGGLSTASTSGDAGYAMQATVTIHNAQFTAIHPTAGAAYALRQAATTTGAYGTAQAKMIVYDGKFQVLTGTESENTPTGTNITSPQEMEYLAGGYFVNYSQLATHINDNCKITRLTSSDPEYADGYRFKVEIGDPVVKLTVGSDEHVYSSFTRPFKYAQQHADATITLLADIDFLGEILYYNAAPDGASTTLDLNGHSIVSEGLTNTFIVFDNANTTFTIKDSGTGGRLSLTNAAAGMAAIYVRRGKLKLESGTIYSRNNGGILYTLFVQATATTAANFEMTGGKIVADASQYAYTILAKSSSAAPSIATINGGEVIAQADGLYAFALTSAPGGYIEVNNDAKVVATGSTANAQALRAESTGRIVANNGLFSSSIGAIVSSANVSIYGGYFNEIYGVTSRNRVEASCTPPYHTLPTTPAEQTTYGAEYVWKVEPLPESGLYADIIDVDNMNKTLTLNVSNWDIDGWPYYINNVAYAKTARAADRTMKIPYTGEPGDAFYVLVNKNNKYGVTTSHRSYIIPQEITTASSLTTDELKPLFVKGTTLTIDADVTAKNVYIAPDATLTIHSGKTLTVDTLFLRTTPNSAAILNKEGTIAGSSMVYYTRIISDKSGYFPFGLPVSCTSQLDEIRLSNGTNPDYKAGSGWILRYYDEPTRATNGPSEAGANWRTPDKTAIIAGGRGYEMYSGVNYYREFYFPVDITALTDAVPVTCSVGSPTDAGWNVLVSPLTYPYANSVEPEGTVISWLQNDGTFEQEIPSLIPPLAVFAYQAPQSGYLSFAGSTIETLLPRRQSPADETTPVQWIQLEIADADGAGDRTSIYSHPTRYDKTYQTGIDVAKLSFEATRALIYSSRAYGEMAFAGVSDESIEQGVALTVYSPSEQELTFSLRENDWLGRLDKVWLVDKQTGTRTDLRTSDYAFQAVAGTTTGRFLIQGQFSTPQGNERIENESLELRGATKVMIKDQLYIRINGHMYDVTGKLVTNR